MDTKNDDTHNKAGDPDEVWTAEEEKVFAAFGVGKNDLAMRRLIRGQRKINGRFYKAIDNILESLKSPSQGPNDLLTKADNYNEGVPGPPPGCDYDDLVDPGGSH